MPELIPAEPGSPEWLAARRTSSSVKPIKLTPYSRVGMIHGAYEAAISPRTRRGYHPAYAQSWMYRRGFARAFLSAREVSCHG